MGAGLLPGELSPLDQILHQGVVPGHPDDAALLRTDDRPGCPLVEDQGLLPSASAATSVVPIPAQRSSPAAR